MSNFCPVTMLAVSLAILPESAVSRVCGAFPQVPRFWESKMDGGPSHNAETGPSLTQSSVIMYSCMDLAAFLPAPMAEMTVAAPVTMSPPAHTPSLLVFPVSSSVTM